MTRTEIREAALELPIEERLRLAQELWESVGEADVATLPDWQRRVLRARLDGMRADPAAGIPWEEVEARLWPEL